MPMPVPTPTQMLMPGVMNALPELPSGKLNSATFNYFLATFEAKSLEAVTMATGMRQKKLGFNFLALYDNTQTQKVSSKSVPMRPELWLMVTENGYYRKNSKIWETSNNCHNCPKNRKV